MSMAPHVGEDLGVSFIFSFSSVGWHVDPSRASAHHRGYLLCWIAAMRAQQEYGAYSSPYAGAISG